MRFLVGLAACIVAFGGVLFYGDRLFGAADRAPELSAEAAEGIAPEESQEPQAGDVSISCREEASERVNLASTGRNPRDARERLNSADNALAQAAVDIDANLAVCWKLVAPPADWRTQRCSGYDPELSRFTMTGKARAAFAQGPAGISSSVRIFANAGQASEYFRLTATRGPLRCMREGLMDFLRSRQVAPRVKSARIFREPPIGADTAIYSLVFSVRPKGGSRQPYPVQVVVFRIGRAVGSVAFHAVFSADHVYGISRLVASRLYRT